MAQEPLNPVAEINEDSTVEELVNKYITETICLKAVYDFEKLSAG